MGKCPAWCEGEQGLFSFSHDRCYATKEMEVCDCLGNEAFCNFYPEKRKAATNPKFGEWISVKEQPEPSEDGEYWCYGYWFGSGRKHFETAEYLGEWKIVNNFILTHWMPLPEPPKEAGTDENA